MLGLLVLKKTRHCCVENLHTFLKHLTYKYALEINVIVLIKFPLKIKTKTIRANKLSFKLRGVNDSFHSQWVATDAS